jgi:hypothetical protein
MSMKHASIDPPPFFEPGRPKLKASDARAIAEFLSGGGKIAKVQDSVTATNHREVVDFLATCGVSVKTFRGDRAYWCDGRCYNPSALVRLANQYRQAQGLPPFAVRLVPWVGGQDNRLKGRP